MALRQRVRQVRAYTLRGGGADYHDQPAGHWIDDHIATPMSVYPEYRASRQSFGLNVLGTLVVEVEADDGTVGFSVTTAGEPGAFIVERHLARFVEGALVTDLERSWDQMYRSTLFYGRRGLVLNAISGVDLALWDLLGRLRQEPVYALLGGKVRDELTMYATGARASSIHVRPCSAAPSPRRTAYSRSSDIQQSSMSGKSSPTRWRMSATWRTRPYEH